MTSTTATPTTTTPTTTKTTSTTTASPPLHRLAPERAQRLLARRSFATLATVSPAGRPHVAGVLYELVDGKLYMNTLRSSRKAHNIAAEPHVAVAVPIRRLPVGPPSLIHFQGTADLLALDDPHVTDLVAAGRLRSLTRHGELDLPDGCFVRVTPPDVLHTYGLGMSLPQLVRHPLAAAGTTSLAK